MNPNVPTDQLQVEASEHRTDADSPKSPPPSKGLSCASCQHRKVKCDRTFPCGNCSRRGERCIPGVAVLPRQRRKRFAERDLLDRLRHYETLLRDNDIKFDPMHKGHPGDITRKLPRETESQSGEADDVANGPLPDRTFKSYWRVINEKKASVTSDTESDDSEDGRPVHEQMRDIWKDVHQKNGYLLPFGKPSVPVDLADRHPDQVTIFNLWQTYLDNVNPLLKVTHTPTLQPQIIQAGSNVASIKPNLNALMFAIYCMAVLSLSDEECLSRFNIPRQAMLLDYQLCCSQALSNCAILCTTDREALTALFLYLLSLASDLDPQSISSLNGIAVRLAKRMSIHMESSYKKMPALEAELRRRLWWSLVHFDARIGELSGAITSLEPTWDCRPPLNVNDFELQDDMQSSPKPSSNVSEALFPVVRSEMAEITRNAAFYLDFVNPALNLIGKRNRKIVAPPGSEVLALAKEMETSFLQYCNPENSVHYMAIWATRGFIAKSKLMEHYASIAHDPAAQNDKQRDAASNMAMTMLECDMKISSSPLVKGFKWYMNIYMPIPAYFQILLDLKKRPHVTWADRAWRVLSDHYIVRFDFQKREHWRVYKILAKFALQAWQATEQYASQEGRKVLLPGFIHKIRIQHETMLSNEAAPHMADDIAKITFDDLPPVQMQHAADTQMFMDQSWDAGNLGLDVNINPVSLLGIDIESIDWDTTEWNPYQNRPW